MTDGATYEAVAPWPSPGQHRHRAGAPGGFNHPLHRVIPILMQAATQDVGPCALMADERICSS
jgi:hypothetical protein